MNHWLTRLYSMRQGLKWEQEQEEGLKVMAGSWLLQPRQQNCRNRLAKCGSWLPLRRQQACQSSEQALRPSSPACAES